MKLEKTALDPITMGTVSITSSLASEGIKAGVRSLKSRAEAKKRLARNAALLAKTKKAATLTTAGGTGAYIANDTKKKRTVVAKAAEQ